MRRLLIVLLLLFCPATHAQDNWATGLRVAVERVPSLDRVAFVKPSGDTTGAADTLALKTADANASVSLIALDGRYYVADPLTVTGKSLHGVTKSKLTYVGVKTDRPVLTVAGGFDSGQVSNFILDCRENARGIEWQRCTYNDICDQVRVERYRQMGANFVDCWGSSVNRLTLSVGIGVALRTSQCNSFRATNVALAGASSVNSAGETDWPSEAELPASNQACVVLGNDQTNQDLTTFENLIIERGNWQACPVVLVKSETTTLLNVRFEGGVYGRCLIELSGSPANQRRGCFFTLDNATLYANGKAECLVLATGLTKCLALRQISCGEALTKHVVSFDGGSHSGLAIEHVEQWTIPANTLVSLENGATLAISNYGIKSR